MNDKVQLYFEPEPLEKSINEKANTLKTSFNKSLKNVDIEMFKSNYEKIPREIYNLAQKDANYIGSDTWRFFKDKVKRYCIDECYRNILVILTDGYMFHEDSKFEEGVLTSYITPSSLRKLGLNKSNYKQIIENEGFGFIPANSNLEDLEILVLGIVNHDKKNNPYGKDILEIYWKEWFEKMGVKRFEIYGAELPTNLESSISNFILSN